MKKITVLVLLLVGSIIPTYATHLMGGEITVQDLGNQEFQVNLIVYRDTLGIPMATTAFINFDGPNGASFSISIPYDSVISGNLLPMYPYGVEVYYFTDTVTLAGNGKWEIFWSDCCRNNAILNLSSPLTESMTLYTSLVTDTTTTNSTPFFLVPAAIFLPQNTPWQYNPLPFDPDGDSLHWSIDQPLNDTGLYCLGYVTPSSSATNVFSIDPITGTISWTADLIGNFVASILVDQYRNGVWMGEIRRDMQFIVVSASPGYPLWSNLSTLPTDINSNYAFNLTEGAPFKLELIATHSDPTRTVFMEAYSEVFQLPLSNATFTETINPPETTGEFNWIPKAGDLRDKTYQVVFRISDGLFTDDRTVLLNVNTPLAINESTPTVGIKVFPNPATDYVYLEIDQTKEQSAVLDVYSISGKKVISQKTIQINSGSNAFVIDTESWQAGTYIFRVEGEEGLMVNQMLVIE